MFGLTFELAGEDEFASPRDGLQAIRASASWLRPAAPASSRFP
jgi:hypothetical protein